MTPEGAWKRAVKILGTDAEVARITGKTRQAVGRWTKCPDDMVLKISRAVRRALRAVTPAPSPHDMRPDLYDQDNKPISKTSRGRSVRGDGNDEQLAKTHGKGEAQDG